MSKQKELLHSLYWARRSEVEVDSSNSRSWDASRTYTNNLLKEIRKTGCSEEIITKVLAEAVKDSRPNKRYR